MSRIFPTLFFLILFCFNSLAQEIPNGSFETWTNGEPDTWNTSNQSVIGFGSFVTVNKDITAPHSGSASAKLTVVTKTIPFIGTKLSIPGVLTLGILNIDPIAQTASVSGGYPFTGMPEKLTGYIKYQPVNNDICAMGWGLTRWNNGVRDTIGFGAIDTSGTINTWTYFEIQLRYLIQEAPDTLNILFLNSNPVDGIDHTGTTLWIDNLSFDYGTVAIAGITSARGLQIYAEPYARQLILTSSFGNLQNLDISLFNMAGIETRNWKRSMQHSTEYLDVNNLPPGTYVIRISAGNILVDTQEDNHSEIIFPFFKINNSA